MDKVSYRERTMIPSIYRSGDFDVKCAPRSCRPTAKKGKKNKDETIAKVRQWQHVSGLEIAQKPSPHQQTGVSQLATTRSSMFGCHMD